jgi:hypothetical protein
VDNPEHIKRLRQTVEVWNTWRGRAGMLLTASLRRAKGMTIPKIAPWVRAAGIIAAAAVLELWWWVGLPGWLTIAMIATAIALAPPLAYGVVYGAWWLWWRLPKRQVDRLALPSTKESADAEDNFRKTIGQLLGGAAVLIGAGFAVFQFLAQQQAAQEQQQTSQNQFLQQQQAAQKQQQANQQQFSEQQQAAHDLLISNQVSKGFEQLASKEPVMRLGGIYALEGVMNTSEQYHGPVLEALCAFVRESTIVKPAPEKTATDVQAALTVIGRRIAGPGVVDLANVSIPQADLHDANLRGADLRGANLSGAYLIGADLFSADLTDANLTYIKVRGADLRGADLRGANLSGAYLINADLRRAKLTQTQLDEACGDEVIAGTKLPEGLTPSKKQCPLPQYPAPPPQVP